MKHKKIKSLRSNFGKTYRKCDFLNSKANPKVFVKVIRKGQHFTQEPEIQEVKSAFVKKKFRISIEHYSSQSTWISVRI
jgi:hypothetical protein